MSRKNAERHVRQQHILASARRLFAENGIDNTSMDEIATAAEYTRRTLYSYFKSRDEICLQVFIEDLQDRWNQQQRALADVEIGLEQLVTWGKALYQYCSDHPQAMELQVYWDFRGIRQGNLRPETFANFEKINDELADGLREIFHRGITDGSMRTHLTIDLCISQFLYSLRAVIHRALSPTYSFATFAPEQYVDHFLELFCRAISD